MIDHLLPFAGAITLAGLLVVAALAAVTVRVLRRRDAQATDKQLLELARL